MTAPLQDLADGEIGALVCSVLNVVVHRLPRGESLAFPGSSCPACGTPIKPYDNVPVVSWLLLRGRCRRCSAPISIRYPALEAITALTFAAVVAVRGADERLLLELPFVAMLIAVAGIDLEHLLVPNKLLLPAAAWGLGAAVLVATPDLPELLIAGAAAFGLLVGAAVAYPAGMGMGDVKLAGVMGLYLGAAVAPALLVAFLAGTIVGLAVIALRGGDRKTGLPFAPFLAAGGLVALLVGSELIDLYSDHFLA
jgi:leader peptidase (prepilin peptidase)/N-methyltransferase